MKKQNFFPLLCLCLMMLLPLLCPLAVRADDLSEAPGGTVTDTASLISALGGSQTAFVSSTGYVTLSRDVRLTAPLFLESGSFELHGGGCVLTIADGASIIVQGGAHLQLGSAQTRTTTDDLILSAKNRTDGQAMIRVEKGGSLLIEVGTVLEETKAGPALKNLGEAAMNSGAFRNCFSPMGGAIVNHGSLFLLGGTITVKDSTEIIPEHGGAIWNNGSIVLSGTVISGTRAVCGGGIWNDETGSVTLYDGAITECTASEKGGGIYNKGTVTQNGGHIDSNTAEQGGGIYNTGVYEAPSGSLSKNQAVLGGGVYNEGTITLSGVSSTMCSAEEKGGAVYQTETGTISYRPGSSIDFPSAKYGGGIFSLGTLTVSGGGISGAKAELGSAIFNAGTLILSDSAYIEKKSEVFQLVTDSVSPILLKTRLTPPRVMTLTFGTEKDGAYQTGASDGSVLLSPGEGASFDVTQFPFSDSLAKRYALASDGTLKNIKSSLPLPLWIGIGALGAALIALAAFGIVRRSPKKKKGESEDHA